MTTPLTIMPTSHAQYQLVFRHKDVVQRLTFNDGWQVQSGSLDINSIHRQYEADSTNPFFNIFEWRIEESII